MEIILFSQKKQVRDSKGLNDCQAACGWKGEKAPS